MAQVSANTLAYDQIYLKIRSFMQKDMQNSFLSKQERIEEYNKLLSEIYESIAGPTFAFDPFIKGEPPRSEKMNKFSSSLADNLNSLAKQLDYLNAKTVNSFNLFFKEIENEKRYSERIASKAKILQMYSKSPSNDIIYIGDSFDNLDQVEVSSIRKNFNPSVIDGSFTLPIKSFKSWNVGTISILASNGFMGNNHEVIQTPTEEGDVYNYIFKNNPGISSVNAIIDSNPLTYFEYEAINVNRTQETPNDVLISENEFCYVNDSRIVSNFAAGELVNWSNHNLNDPLQLKVVLDGASSQTLSNCVVITPYFQSTNLVKVNKVTVTDSAGNIEEVLSEPIYIGSSLVPLNLTISKNYNYNKATIRYSERKTSRVEIWFEQPNYKDITIQHLYWKPNYSNQNISNSPFVGLSRFNPDSLNRDIYEEVQYDKKLLIPSTSNPNQFKKIGLASIPKFRVSLKKKPMTYNKWVLTFSANNKKVYFYDWNEDLTDSTADHVVTTELPNTPIYEAGILKIGSNITSSTNSILTINSVEVDVGDKVIIKNQSNPVYNGAFIVKQKGSVSEKWKLVREIEIQWTDDVVFDNPSLTPMYFETELAASQYTDSIEEYINILNGEPVVSGGNNYYITNPGFEYVSRQGSAKTESIDVPLISQYETYPAKRMAIGIRDIAVGYEVYSNQAEIISTPYNFDLPIDSLMLSVDSTIESIYTDKIKINYYISLNQGAWISISPIQLDSNGIAEVLAFNQNILENNKLPGVAYLSFPEIPLTPNNVRVKIEVIKDRSSNITPVIYSYELIVKVKR